MSNKPAFFCAAILLVLAWHVTGQTAPPASDIFLADLTRRGGQLALNTPVNITRRDGYDNQPAFLPDGKSLLFTSIRENNQADIYRYELATQKTERLTDTSESEYSPTVTPDKKFFSTIRVEADRTQRLWKFPLPGGAPSLVLHNLKPVGYHVWVDADTLALFVLGQPNSLQLVNVKTEQAEVVANNIGRALHRIPGHANKLSFVHKVADKEWVIKELEVKTRQSAPLINTLPGSEDCVWLPDGTLLLAQGSKLFKWQRGKDKTWQEVADLSAAGLTGITRLAVSPKGDRLALVAMPQPQ